MRRKLLLIALAGYVVGALAAIASVYMMQLGTNAADAQASGGMYACSDAVLFCIVFGVFAAPATVLLIVAIIKRKAG